MKLLKLFILSMLIVMQYSFAVFSQQSQPAEDKTDTTKYDLSLVFVEGLSFKKLIEVKHEVSSNFKPMNTNSSILVELQIEILKVEDEKPVIGKIQFEDVEVSGILKIDADRTKEIIGHWIKVKINKDYKIVIEEKSIDLPESNFILNYISAKPLIDFNPPSDLVSINEEWKIKNDILNSEQLKDIEIEGKMNLESIESKDNTKIAKISISYSSKTENGGKPPDFKGSGAILIDITNHRIQKIETILDANKTKDSEQISFKIKSSRTITFSDYKTNLKKVVEGENNEKQKDN